MIRSSILPGDILVTPNTNEVYIYLGYYRGRPDKCGYFYSWPKEGYVYMFLDNCTYKKSDVSSDAVCRNIYTRSFDMLAGNGAYTKNYKPFERKIGHVDIFDDPKVRSIIQNLYGLVRLGDKKPKTREV